MIRPFMSDKLVSSPRTLSIRTSRLILRKAREDDLEDVHAFLSQEDAVRYWSSSPAYSNLAQSLDWLETMIASPHNGVTDFVIELINTDYGSTSKPRPGPVIGKLGCWDSTDVISFILNKSFWGKGYAADALQAFSWYMFAFTGESQDGRRKTPADKLIADVDPRNERSRTLLRRCGFVEFARGGRTRKTHLGWCDSIYYELTRKRWEFLYGTSSRT